MINIHPGLNLSNRPVSVRWGTVQQFLLNQGKFGIIFLQVIAILDLYQYKRAQYMILASIAGCLVN